jgi:peptidylprolyl isomerase
MITQDSILASLSNTQLSLGAFLKKLHTQGRLRPLVLEILIAQLVRQQAQQEGLTVSDEELQSVADLFRRLHGLHTAADTHTWLLARGLTVDGFEAGLEDSLLAAKLKQHLTAGQVDDYFSAHQSELERLRLAHLQMERDELARELASQVREDGIDLEDVARQHGLTVAHLQLFRKQLHGSLAETLNAAKAGELIGPLATPQGFALVVIQERQPAKLDPMIRQSIQNELFAFWLNNRIKEASFDLAVLGGAG